MTYNVFSGTLNPTHFTSACLCVRVSCSNYELKENKKVIALLNNFDDFISEESLWQLSESIKPRHSSKHLNPT